MIQILLAAVLVAFTVGSTLGGFAVHRWYAVDQLQSQVAAYKADSARYRSAIGIAKSIDEEDDAARDSNEKILSAAIEKLNRTDPVQESVDELNAKSFKNGKIEVIKHVEVAVPLPYPTKVSGSRKSRGCVDPGSMRTFRALK